MKLSIVILFGLLGLFSSVSAFAFAPTKALPAEYRQVEYIQGDGTAYILTDYTANTAVDVVSAEFEITSGNVATIWCTRGRTTTTSTFTLFYLGSADGNFRFDYYTQTTGKIPLVPEEGKIYTVTAEHRKVVFSSGESYQYTSGNAFTASGPLMIFASHYNGTSNNVLNRGDHKLYSFKVWRSGQLVRDFVPCIRRSDGVVGLYDRGIGRFFANTATSGAFIPGPAAEGLQALPVFPVDFTGLAAVPEVSVVDAATGTPVDPSLYETVCANNTAVGTATVSFSGRQGTALEGATGSADYEVARVFRVTGAFPAAEGDGQSWSSPMSWTNALATASTSTVATAVWLSGTCVLPASSPTYTFRMHVALRGGFVGTESSPSERLPRARSVIDAGGTNAVCLVFSNNRKLIVDGIDFIRGKERGLRRNSSWGELFVTNCGFIACGAGTAGRSGSTFMTDGTGGRGLSIVGNGYGTASVVCSDISGNRLSGSGHDGGAGVAVLAHNLRRLYLDSCNIETNTHNHWRGGACQGVYLYNTPATIEGCLFRGNTGWNGNACALLLSGKCSGSELRNCVFTGNFIFGAYGIVVASLSDAASTLSVDSCTFAYNYLQNSSAALRMVKGAVTARNCVFWKNVRLSGSVGADIHLLSGSTGDIDWVCCEGTGTDHFSSVDEGSLVLGENITIPADPLFALPTEEFTALPRSVKVYSSYYRMTFDDIAKIDVHPLSSAGYFNDAGEMLFADGVISPLVDAGDPEGDYSREAGGDASAAGGRLNIGAYGNTAYASRTPYSRLDVASGPTVSFEGPYTQPTVSFTLGGEGVYCADVVVSISTNGVDWIYSSHEMLALTNGQSVAWLVPKYYLAGDPIYARVTLESNTASFGVTGEVATVTGVVPRWSEKGGDPGRVIHVRAGATGNGDGTSWTDAYETLTEAYAAVTDEKNEIWYSGTNYLSSAQSAVSFTKPLTIRGGFTAAENDPSERPDGLRSLIDGHNAYDTLFQFSNSAALTVERIDFMRARAQGVYRSGGAGDITFIDCRFSGTGVNSRWNHSGGDNFFSNGGGGAKVVGSSSSRFVARGCDFSGNYTLASNCHDVGNGGGLFVSNFKEVVLDGCTFMTNAPSGDAGWRSGSTVALGVYSSPLSVSNCCFVGNVNASPYAFGVCVYGACSNSVFRNCIFAGNTLAPGNASMNGLLFAKLSTTNHTMLVDNCTFAYNFNRNGTAFNACRGNFTVRNSIFHANVVSSTAGHGADIFCGAEGRVRVLYSMFDEEGVSSCSVVDGGDLEFGEGCVYGDPMFVTSTAEFQSLTGNGAYPIGTGNFQSSAQRCSLDLHLLSTEGYRKNDGGLYKTENVISPALDAGDPSVPVGAEPAPDGGVINLGAYGGTQMASMTPFALPEITGGPSVTFLDGYTQPLVSFTVGGEGAYSATAVVRISLDGGDSWVFESNPITSISNGDSVGYLVPEYFIPGASMTVRVDVSASGIDVSQSGGEVTVEGALPRWYGKGGGAGVIHVRPGATGKKDGTSWTDAVEDFHEGMKLIDSVKNEIWVSGTNVLAGSSPTFALKFPVTVRGGFDASENSPSERRAGERAFIDGGGKYDCFIFSNTADAPLTLDGVAFVRGAYRAVKKTGGSGDVTVTNCAFSLSAKAGTIEKQNSGPSQGAGGGGISMIGDGKCTLSVSDSSFEGNETDVSEIGYYDCGWGLAGYVYRFSSARFENCHIATNVIRMWRGGGCHGLQFYATPVTFEKCVFKGNLGWNSGASVLAFDGACSNSVLRNCSFAGNMASSSSGIVYVNMDSTNSTLSVENCTFAYNKCSGNSVLSVNKGTVSVKDSVFSGNVRTSTSRAADIYVATNSRCIVSYSLFKDGSTACLQAALGGIVETNSLIFADPLLVTSEEEFSAMPKSKVYYNGLTWLAETSATDFNVHLRGGRGYVDENTGDVVTRFSRGIPSPAIDAGSPASDWTGGPDRSEGWHGRRVNMGAYGNTPYETMSAYPGLILRVR